MRAILIGAALLASASVASANALGGGHASGGRSARGSSHGLASSAGIRRPGFHVGGGPGFDGFGGASGGAWGFGHGGGFAHGLGFYGGEHFRRVRWGYPLYGDGLGYGGYADAGYGDDPGEFGPREPYGPSVARQEPMYPSGPVIGLYNHSGQGAYAYGYNGYAETPALPVIPAYGGYAQVQPAAYPTPAAYVYEAAPAACGC